MRTIFYSPKSAVKVCDLSLKVLSKKVCLQLGMTVLKVSITKHNERSIIVSYYMSVVKQDITAILILQNS